MQRVLFPLLIPVLTVVLWSCTAHGQRNEEQEEAPTPTALHRYQEEIDRFQEQADRNPQSMEACLGLYQLYRALGDYEKALEQATKATEMAPSDGSGWLIYGETLALTGKYREAETALVRSRSSSSAPLQATLQLGALYRDTGRRSEARLLFSELIQAYQQGRTRSVDDVLAVALAAWYLERIHDANRLFSEATAQDPAHRDAYVAWGRLFLEKYNRAEAVSIFEDALKIDPGYPPALVGMAEALAETRGGQAEARCRQALEVNPNLIEAHQLLARLSLTDEAYDEAMTWLERALRVNPSSPSTRALMAATHHAAGRQAEYEAECARVLSINPGYGQLYAILADNLSKRYRFREAIAMGQRAIALDPELWSAYASLGVNLSRVGEEEEGRRYLDEAFSGDAFNTWTYNTLNLFDSFEHYTTHRSAHFILKLHKDDDPVYVRLALDLLEEGYAAMAPRYGFSLSKPVLVEIFPKHDDFAVRISGLPGAGALLGVCFGEVVVADSPRARPAGSFNWGQTLWHELAHVIHLQLTRNRIPRWLAEGIAVYEARRARPEWNIDMDPEFASAVERKTLIKVSELNSGFTRPRSAEQVIMSYYQASIVVEYIIERHGFEAIRRMLRMYNEDRKTEQIIQDVFGVSFERFDEAFTRYAEERTSPTRRALRFTPSTQKEMTEADLRLMVAEQPESFYAHLFLGRALQTTGKTEEAIRTLTRARDMVPGYIHAENPYRLLADIYRKKGDDASAIRELEALTAIDENNIESNKELAQIYVRQRRDEDMIRALSRAVMVNPFDAGARNMLGEAFERLKRYDRAVTEFEAALRVETTDMALAHYNLARVYLAAGRKTEAKSAAIKALEIAPNYEAAQEILLKTVQ